MTWDVDINPVHIFFKHAEQDLIVYMLHVAQTICSSRFDDHEDKQGDLQVTLPPASR